MTKFKVSPKDVAAILHATFPDYKGRKVFVEARESVTLHDLNWSGGSRSQYRTCTLDGKPVGSADRLNNAAPWDHKAEGMKVPMLPEVLIVRHSIFCGKDIGIDIYVHPDSQLAVLPAPPRGVNGPPSFLF